MPKRCREYYHLPALLKRWQVSEDDLAYDLETGNLRVCVMVSELEVEVVKVERDTLRLVDSGVRTGLAQLKPVDFTRLYSQGTVTPKALLSVDNPGCEVRMLYNPEQGFAQFSIRDLRFMSKDVEAYEAIHEITPVLNAETAATTSFWVVENDYRTIHKDNQTYTFGDIQAKVLKLLHSAKVQGEPWVHGKQLLDAAGSRAVNVGQLFKHKGYWKLLIESNAQGYYRLRSQ